MTERRHCRLSPCRQRELSDARCESLGCPKPLLIVFADRLQFLGIRFGSVGQIVRNAQFPPRVGKHVLELDARVEGCQEGLAILAEAEYSLRGNHRRRTAARQAYTLAPPLPFAVSGAGEE